VVTGVVMRALLHGQTVQGCPSGECGASKAEIAVQRTEMFLSQSAVISSSSVFQSAEIAAMSSAPSWSGVYIVGRSNLEYNDMLV